ncbi:MAG: SpoIID/LytB domain-containing protein [Bacteroidales bacterium]
MEEPKISVGLSVGRELIFLLHTPYFCGGVECEGEQRLCLKEGMVEWNGSLYPQLLFIPKGGNPSQFTLFGVTIGVGFHWQRKEDHLLRGSLKVVVEGGSLVAINIIGLEEYLKSVISSEMSPNASNELLKAHAVLSRSWLMAQLNAGSKSRELEGGAIEAIEGGAQDPLESIKWYDRQEHTLFNFCNDDHCQRYQGFAHLTPAAVKAVEESRGELLLYGGEICDARYSKCCGGYLEEFQNCWGEIHHPYLLAKRDAPQSEELDLSREESATKWIKGEPPSFCNCKEDSILSQVLKEYDRETLDFYRWSVEYRGEELSQIVEEKGNFGLGEIIDLIPLERGTSGRVVKLKIVGSRASKIIGKELEIRRILSPSHLYSSAFVVERAREGKSGGVLFKLYGAGWGHGVGLCQIGAAVMGERGYSYLQILHHYFSGVTVQKLY